MESDAVMAGLDPAIPLRDALCPTKRDHRVKPGDDKENVARPRAYKYRGSGSGVISLPL